MEKRALSAGALLVLLSAVWMAVGLGHVWAHPAVGWIPAPLAALLSAYGCWTVTRRRTLEAGIRRFWRHMGVATVLMAAGSVANAIDATGGPAPSQRVGDVTLGFYLGVVTLVLWALLRLPSQRRSRGDWVRFGIDGCVILLTVLALLWQFSLRNHQEWVAQTGSAGVVVIMSVVSFLSMAAFVKVAFTGMGSIDRRAAYILAGGSALSVCGGSMAPFLVSRPYLSTSIISVPLAAMSVLCAALTQWRAAKQPPRPRRTGRISVVPYVAVAVTDVLLLTAKASDPTQTRLMEIAAVALTVLVVTRQIIALRDNNRLLGTVDAQLRQLRGYQEKLTHQATHDGLTGAANRVHFEQVVEGLLAAGSRFCLALLDLDDFKTVNDRNGHHVGDQLITTVSERLAAVAGEHGTVCRLGGDEFALVLPADGIAARLDRLVAEVGLPARLDGADIVPGVSAGVTESRSGDTPAEVLRRADVAMYAAKAAGGRRWQWFDQGMDAAAADAAGLTGDLRGALARGELFPLYQPIVELPTGAAVGAEILLRWRHPQRGLVPPDIFIPLAERGGTITEIGAWVFRQACDQAAAWRATFGAEAPYVSVNVSARQLAEPTFVDAVTEILRATGADPANLMIEVTETAVLNSAAAIGHLARLRALGLRVALDDFGTGHSSLSLLLDCPVDVLKVDKSFVSGDSADHAGAIIVRNLIGFTTDFRIDAVAEGVETAAQADRLHETGYHLAQGYLFGRPMPATDFEAVFAALPVKIP